MRYVEIGGIAAIVQGVPRTTVDVDLLIEASDENARRLLAALSEAGIGAAALTSADGLLRHEITIFKDVVRIDVQTMTPGVAFADAWSRRIEREISGTKYWLLSRQDLVATRRAAGRPKDLEDIRVLESGGA